MTYQIPNFLVKNLSVDMSNVTMAPKGKINIPGEACSKLKVGAGEQVEFVPFSPCRYELLASNS